MDTEDGKSRLEGVLIVGTGTGVNPTDRTNGLRILDDGTVLIQPKGDLRMHDDFKKGPTP